MNNVSLTTKKQRREQEWHGQLKSEKKTARLMLLKRIGLWLGVVLGLGFLVWGLAKLGSSTTTTSDTPLAVAVTDQDWIRGNANASVTLVEYSDFQCPACKAASPLVRQLEQQFSDKLRIVYRHYPLPQHRNAEAAAQAAEAAGRQGKFWEMHDRLFEEQSVLAEQSNLEATFSRFAEQLGLNKDVFMNDFKAPAAMAKIAADRASGNQSGVEATPSFFLNGKKLNLQNFDDLTAAVTKIITGSN